MSSIKRTWYTFEWKQMPNFTPPTFDTDVQALNYYDQIVALGDPSIKITALMEHTSITTEDVKRHPLGARHDWVRIAERVKRAMTEQLKDGGTLPSGEYGVEWIVKQVLEVVDE